MILSIIIIFFFLKLMFLIFFFFNDYNSFFEKIDSFKDYATF